MVHAESDCAARNHRNDSYDESFLHCLSAAKVGEIIQSAKSFAHFLHISGKVPDARRALQYRSFTRENEMGEDGCGKVAIRRSSLMEFQE